MTTKTTQPIASMAPTMPVKAKQEEQKTWRSTVSRTVSNIVAKAQEHKKAIAVGIMALGGMYAAHSYLNADPQPGPTDNEAPETENCIRKAVREIAFELLVVGVAGTGIWLAKRIKTISPYRNIH